MTPFTILEQGRDADKDQWYARCIYGKANTEVTVILSGDVMERLKEQGVTDFPLIVEKALEAARQVEWGPNQVVIFYNTPIYHDLMASFGPPDRRLRDTIA